MPARSQIGRGVGYQIGGYFSVERPALPVDEKVQAADIDRVAFVGKKRNGDDDLFSNAELLVGFRTQHQYGRIGKHRRSGLDDATFRLRQPCRFGLIESRPDHRFRRWHCRPAT